MNGIGIFFIIVIVVAIGGAVGWVVFTQLRARRLGLPAPAISSYNPFAAHSEPVPYGGPNAAPGGIRGWFNDKFRPRNNRSAAGAYEQPLNTGYSGRRGFGPLDPDEAWDSRVGTEADAYGYEEQELGFHPAGGRGGGGGGGGNPYNGNEYPMNLAATPGVPPHGYPDEQEARGRPRDRDGASPLPSAGIPGKGVNRNPFDDDGAEPSNISLRGGSPRRVDTAAAAKAAGSHGPNSADSPSERRSMFRENV